MLRIHRACLYKLMKDQVRGEVFNHTHQAEDKAVKSNKTCVWIQLQCFEGSYYNKKRHIFSFIPCSHIDTVVNVLSLFAQVLRYSKHLDFCCQLKTMEVNGIVFVVLIALETYISAAFLSRNNVLASQDKPQTLLSTHRYKTRKLFLMKSCYHTIEASFTILF